ncbi:pathogenesis-related protein 1 [Medicago truncatula]|uniref:CAP, cysteine-rich secretory protein, antigen 5 n=1 Tax=Medicago truncatula TaxID=3880 RepID=G7IFE0_MEDTR|nr:pathogenesis-related protein 1 [Medicago truncatula]AES63618.1 CAP, cysteine-rich secretory protein, antigen 5 [Medicago truncatula]
MCSFSLWFVLGLIFIVGSHVAQAKDSPANYVKAHNKARSAVDSFIKIPKIVWDKKIAAYAQNYANQRKDCKPIPSDSGGRYGENIAVSTGHISGRKAVKLWADEKPHFDNYLNKCFDGECHHFTQVVWSGSLRLGCGKVKCNNGGTFVTCNYYPPGNIPGQLPYQ